MGRGHSNLPGLAVLAAREEAAVATVRALGDPIPHPVRTRIAAELNHETYPEPDARSRIVDEQDGGAAAIVDDTRFVSWQAARFQVREEVSGRIQTTLLGGGSSSMRLHASAAATPADVNTNATRRMLIILSPCAPTRRSLVPLGHSHGHHAR
jgi:hypothetical protein